jgi:hypothetical protein
MWYPHWPGILAVLCLFLACGPPAIRRFVVSVVVNPFDRVKATRSKSHICEEILKRLHPTFADFYTAPAIATVVRSAGIRTPLFHLLPRAVLGSRCPIMPRSTVFCNGLSLQTTTGPVFARSEIGGAGQRNVAAIAQTTPDRSAMLFRFKTQHEQSGESLASQIIHSWHGETYTNMLCMSTR